MSNPSTESLTQQDLEACLAVVHRYASESLALLCERHEAPMAATDVRTACLDLQALGVLHPDQTPAMGIWDDPASTWAREWSWRALRELGRVNAGVAVQTHAQAVAWHLDRCAGQAPRANGSVVCSGFMGFGRDALVAEVADQVLSTDQVRCLADNWGLPTLDQPRYLFSLPDWEWVWLPVWTAGQQWTWVQWARDMVAAQALPQAHGLDELTLFALSIKPQHRDAVPRECVQITGAVARQAWIEVQAMQSLGLLAISVGAVAAAWARARDYALIRHQGGQAIIGHAAVQALLAEASAAVADGEQALQSWASPRASWPHVRQAWAQRLKHQSALSAGASAALQVLGGMGYMQDNGMEKTLRDLNVLRLMSGAPAEFRYILAYWDSLSPMLGEVTA